jgi:SAM-dependent methyltransferase
MALGELAVRDAPVHLHAAYTLGGVVPYERFFVDDTDGGKGTHYSYPADDIAAMLKSARQSWSQLSAKDARSPPFGNRRWGHWVLVQALATVVANFKGSWSAAVFGSQEPWAETYLLAAGASEVLTIEYNNLTYEHPALRTLTVAALEEQLAAGAPPQVDVALSLSSFDHDGLGRYGDPLRPEGDLRAMETAWRVLRPGGRLLLSVPVGPDVLVWNLHRRYGARRLPLLLAGWEDVARVGWEEERLHADASYLRSCAPRRTKRTPPHRPLGARVTRVGAQTSPSLSSGGMDRRASTTPGRSTPRPPLAATPAKRRLRCHFVRSCDDSLADIAGHESSA